MNALLFGTLLVGVCVFGGRYGRRAVLRHGVNSIIRSRPRRPATPRARSGATIVSPAGMTHRAGAGAGMTACGRKIGRPGKATGRRCSRCF